MYIHDNVVIREKQYGVEGLVRATFFSSLAEFAEKTYNTLRYKNETDKIYKRAIKKRIYFK